MGTVKISNDNLDDVLIGDQYLSLTGFREIMEKKKQAEGPVPLKSGSLTIVYQILNGKILAEDMWEYLKRQDKQDFLIDILLRLPHSEEVVKKRIIDILSERKYFCGNQIRFWIERFNGSRELTLYLLKKEEGSLGI